MRRAFLLLIGVPFLLACGLLRGLAQMRQSVEFYATQLPQTLESQRPTLEAAATQIGRLAGTAAATSPQPPTDRTAVQGFLSDLETIRSGRERFASILIMGDRRFILFEWEHRFDRDQKAEMWIYRERTGEKIQVVVKGGTAWLLQGDQWIMWSGNPEEVRPALGLTNWQDLAAQQDWERVRKERIAGLEVVYYRVRNANISPPSLKDLQVPGAPPLAGEPQVQSFEAHVWVTSDGYLVKGQARWNVLLPLQNGQQQPATVEVTWEVSDINQPVDIPVPEVASQAPKAPIPMPADAKLLSQTNQPPTWIYQVPSWDMETGVTYMRQTLTAQSFEIKESNIMTGFAVFRVVSPQGQVWEIMLTPVYTGQGVTVNIILRP